MGYKYNPSSGSLGRIVDPNVSSIEHREAPYVCEHDVIGGEDYYTGC